MAAENFPESKGRNVSQPCRENNVANEAVGVASVRDESEVTEHPADVNKTNNRKGYALQFAVRAIKEGAEQFLTKPVEPDDLTRQQPSPRVEQPLRV